LKEQRKPAVAKPSFRNLTPKVSMASDVSQELKDRSLLIWPAVNGVCKLSNLLCRVRADRATPRMAREVEHCLLGSLPTYNPIQAEKTRKGLSERRWRSEVVFVEG